MMAVGMGYATGMEADQRKSIFDQAQSMIDSILSDPEVKHPLAQVIRISNMGVLAMKIYQDDLKDKQEEWAAKLPISKWVDRPECRGFTLFGLAKIVGEAGNLLDYDGPAKLWKRMGCAPFTKDGITRMGSTWKLSKGLSAGDWEEFGYCPRRRSVFLCL